MNDNSKTSIKDVLNRAALKPNKGLGQNFLVNRNTAQRLVELAGVTDDDTIIEVGVGLGALTLPIANSAGKVVGIEFDAGIIRHHAEEDILPGNVTLLHQDVLKTDFRSLFQQFGRLKIMSNLPYSISNPFLFKLLENQNDVAWAVLMLQKEVAQRLTAAPRTKEYGVLTVLLTACASVRMLMHVGPNQFHPRPKVDSAVVHIQFHPVPERARKMPPYEFPLLRRVVNTAFQQRRKKLTNTLAALLPDTKGKETIGELLERANINPNARPEELPAEKFVALTNLLAAQHGLR